MFLPAQTKFLAEDHRLQTHPARLRTAGSVDDLIYDLNILGDTRIYQLIAICASPNQRTANGKPTNLPARSATGVWMN